MHEEIIGMLRAIQNSQATQREEITELQTTVRLLGDRLDALERPTAVDQERPSYADVLGEDPPPAQRRRTASQPSRVRFQGQAQPVRAQSLDARAARDDSLLRRQVRITGLAQALTIDEVKAALALIIPLPDGATISTRALYDNKAVITLKSEDDAKALLEKMRSTRFQHLGHSLYANKMLEPHQALLGWRLRTIKRALQQGLSLGGRDVAVCYRSSSVFVQRKLVCFHKEEKWHFTPEWPACVAQDALLEELQSRG